MHARPGQTPQKGDIVLVKFHHWAHLNEEGKKLFGEIFPDGIVPVVNMLPSPAKLGGKTTRMFKVDIKQLSTNQMTELLEILSRKFNAPKDAIKRQIQTDGFVPLRKSMTSGSGTDQMGLFI